MWEDLTHCGRYLLAAVHIKRVWKKEGLLHSVHLAFPFAVKLICFVVVVAAEFFADVRNSVSRCPFWTMDQCHSVNLLGFQH